MFSTKINSYDYRTICLISACLIYAIFGSPTPDNISIIEIIIAILIALSIGVGRSYDAFVKNYNKRFWKSAGQIFLIYGMTVPIIIGVINNNSLTDILRDIFPFLFLFLPMFLLPLLRAKPYYFKNILLAIIIIGILFSLRSIMMRFYNRCFLPCPDELLYLENMPTVLFACLIMIGTAMSRIIKGINIYNIAIFSLLVIISLIPITAMITTLQRASIGSIAIYIILLLGYYIFKNPYRAVILIIIGTILSLIINISFSSIFYELWNKTQNVGFNMRFQELATIWDIVTTNITVFLFGIGWGGQFYSPAVGGLSVNFTHNFFTTLLLKTGILGVISCIAYIAGLLERLSRVVIKNPVFGLALTFPILIDLTLYASFKSLDFGLVLLLISGSLVYFRDNINER